MNNQLNSPTDRQELEPTDRWGAIFDLAAVVTLMIVVKQGLLPWSQLYAGPASTLSAMILATYLLRRRGLDWGDLGLRWPANWVRTVFLTVATIALFLVFSQTAALSVVR